MDAGEDVAREDRVESLDCLVLKVKREREATAKFRIKPINARIF